jgi:hypothetical protein
MAGYGLRDMDWDWVVRNAKLLDRQNRLGFVVTLAAQLASKTSDLHRSRSLREYAAVLERFVTIRYRNRRENGFASTAPPKPRIGICSRTGRRRISRMPPSSLVPRRG